MQMADNNLPKVRKVAEKLALDAGQMIVSGLTIGIQRDWKADHTPVTDVDKAINQLVIDTIHREFPTHSILSEEGSDLSRSKEYVWVCDPIDGTFPFMHGIPVSTFTLALVQGGQPIFGLIYDPFMKRLFIAEENTPTQLNGTNIHPTAAKSIKGNSVGIVFWKDNIDIFSPLITKLVDTGSATLDFRSIAYMDAMVACGEFAATIFPGESAHDSAAAKIIVERSGGIFSSLTGEI